MKLLVYRWGSNNEPEIEESLRRMGHELIPFAHPCRHYTKDMELSMAMIGELNAQKAEGIFSLNYFPILSLIAGVCQIPYYSWVYDCPHFTLYSEPVFNPMNRIGVFERGLAAELKEKGAEGVFHLPLWSGDFSKALSQVRKGSRFSCDISFVGSLYTGEYDYYAGIEAEVLPATEKALSAQEFDYAEDHLGPFLRAGGPEVEVLKGLLDKERLRPGEEYFMKDEQIIRGAILEKQVTVRERRDLLGAFGERFGREYSFRIHTASEAPPEQLKPFIREPVDYRREMPLVFSGSRINLNITLRSIREGIPLRALDILSCGGFLLSNRQAELAECFKEGEELELFDSPEEALEKAAFYLSHEERRREIAENGFKAVKERFDLNTKLEALLGNKG